MQIFKKEYFSHTINENLPHSSNIYYNRERIWIIDTLKDDPQNWIDDFICAVEGFMIALERQEEIK